jgi:hypothetical protein
MSEVISWRGARLPRAPMLLRTLRPTVPGQGTPAWGALRVVIIDGFDESLQATDIHRADYLEQPRAFR